MKRWLVALALLGSVALVYANPVTPVDSTGADLFTTANPGKVATTGIAPTSSAATITSASVGTSSAQALAGATRIYLALKNESASAFVACSLGGTAALNTAGSITITPYGSFTWEGSYVPSDAINCIASGAATPLTIVSK